MKNKPATCVSKPKVWPEYFPCVICGKVTRNLDCLPPIKLFPVGYCKRCGVLLLDPTWIRYGYGPACWRAVQDEAFA
jgi:hypothetical protein